MTSFSTDDGIAEARTLAESLLTAADLNCKRLQSMPGHVQGVQALVQRIQTEKNVLIKGFKRPRWLKLDHVISSNLHHLGAVAQIASILSDKVDAVLKKYRDVTSNMPVFVDVVANGGLLWIKVVCRCPNTLQLAHCTGGRAGERAPLHQARTLLSLATQHKVLYSTPKVAFIFCKGVSATVFEALCRDGIIVCTPYVLPDPVLPASRYLPQDEDDEDEISSLLFDDCNSLEQHSVKTTSFDVAYEGANEVTDGSLNGSRKLELESNAECTLRNRDSVDQFDGKNFEDSDLKNGNICKYADDECLENTKTNELLHYHSESADDDSMCDKLFDKLKKTSQFKQHEDGKRIDSEGDLNSNDGNSDFREEGIVLRCLDASMLEVSGKKQWPLCSDGEIVEIAQNLKDYANKCDWAAKAKNSQTFVSLCRNSHYVTSPPVAQDLDTNVPNSHDAKNTYNDEQKLSMLEYGTNVSVSFTSEREPQKFQEGNLENSSRFRPQLKEVINASSESPQANFKPQTVSNLNESNSNCASNTSTNTTQLPNFQKSSNLTVTSVEGSEELNTPNILPRIKSDEVQVIQNIKPGICESNKDQVTPNKLPETLKFHEDQVASHELPGTFKSNEDQITYPKLPGALRFTTEEPILNTRRYVCLDVPTMIAYIANTSNGHSHCHFKDSFLRQQAKWEQEEPIKPVIEKYWQDCEVLVCREALKRFESIVGVMAGEQELRRARQLVACVTVVPDQDDLKGVLQACGGITVSSRIIFGTALHYKALLITANRRFVRSALTQGVSVAALLHNPRALTEQKQLLAVGCSTPIAAEEFTADAPDVSSAKLPPQVPASTDALVKVERQPRNAGVGRKPPSSSEQHRKQVLTCLSSARYLSTMTPVSLLSNE